MIPPEAFVRHKCDTASLKKIFSQPRDAMTEKQRMLLDLVKSRIEEGISKNLRDARFFHAIDTAYDAPYKQITPTLMRDALSKNLSYDETLKAFKSWGLDTNNVFCERKEGNKTVKEINAPVFFDVLIPIVKSYVNIRVAKLFNERNLTPLFEYKPAQQTSENRVRCGIVTDVVNKISRDMGYPAVLRNAIFKAILYGKMLMFPRDIWWTQEGIHYEQRDPAEIEAERQQHAERKAADPDYEVPEVHETKEVRYVEREGIRYIQPPPTRFFHDLHHGLPTFNSDNGCEYAGYWSVTRWGEIEDNPQYWTKEQISFGQNWYSHAYAGSYFQTIYPCNISFPTPRSSTDSDREERAAYYTDADRDKAVFLSMVWMKIIPKRYGIGTLDIPVWMRFDVAGDTSIVWAGPSSYAPCLYAGYDADEMRDRNPGLGLELLPFQDHLQNILSHIILSTKQNLANVNFYDTNVIDENVVKRLENSQEMMYRGMFFVPFDSLKLSKLGPDVKQAFHSVNFSKANVAEETSCLWTIVSMMERLLQFSAQEVGSAASHQQSASEMRMIASTANHKAMFTGSFIDDMQDAWMKQLFDGFVAYGEEQIVAEISDDIPELEQLLEEMGINMVQNPADKRSVIVALAKTSMALRYSAFVARHSTAMQGVDREMAMTMIQMLQIVANNQLLMQEVGAKPIVSLIELSAKMAGAPQDFELEEDINARAMQNIQALQQQLADMSQKIVESAVQASNEQTEAQIEQVYKQVDAKIQRPVAAEMKQNESVMLENQKNIDELQEKVAYLEGLIGQRSALAAT